MSEQGRQVPDVKGISRVKSAALEAREEAKGMQKEVNNLEGIDRAEYERTRAWTAAQNRWWKNRRNMLQGAWTKAEDLSLAAGHDFTDRRGIRRKLAGGSIVEGAIRLYMEKYAHYLIAASI